jgi:hypothetical integral membrane protein (TIGR02206 family)
VIFPLAASAFHTGSVTHLVTVAVCAALTVGLAWLGLRARRRGPASERALCLGWTGFLLAFQLFGQAWQNWPGHFDVRYTLPLHLCDLVILAIPFALLGPWRFPRTLLYFWGLGLSLFAFILPILREGPDHLAFWVFWIGHLQIFASAAYLVAVKGYRPRGHDVAVGFGTTCLYVALILPVNVALGVDYGSVGPDPSSAGMLGPWPWRVPVLVALEGLLFTLLWAPWKLLPRRKSDQESA